MINLEVPRKLKPLVVNAHQVAMNLLRGANKPAE